MQQINGQNFSYSSFKVFLALLFILGLIFLLSYIMKKVNMKNGGLLNSSMIKIISRYPLGERRYLYIVKIDKETILLGVTPQTVNYIKSLELNEESVNSKHNEKSGSFFNIFKEKLKEVKSVEK